MPNRFSGEDAERAALDAYIKLWRASHAVETAANRHLADHGLTLSQFAVLEALYHLGPLSQRQLADKILRSSGNLTMVIDNLERDRQVKRERDPADRRAFQVTLTDGGRELIEGLLPGHARGIQALFGVLDPDEMDQLRVLTRKLGLEAQRQDAERSSSHTSNNTSKSRVELVQQK